MLFRISTDAKSYQHGPIRRAVFIFTEGSFRRPHCLVRGLVPISSRFVASRSAQAS